MSILIGENGIVNKVEYAKKETNNSIKDENQKLAEYLNIIDIYTTRDEKDILDEEYEALKKEYVEFKTSIKNTLNLGDDATNEEIINSIKTNNTQRKGIVEIKNAISLAKGRRTLY